MSRVAFFGLCFLEVCAVKGRHGLYQTETNPRLFPYLKHAQTFPAAPVILIQSKHPRHQQLGRALPPIPAPQVAWGMSPLSPHPHRCSSSSRWDPPAHPSPPLIPPSRFAVPASSKWHFYAGNVNPVGSIGSVMLIRNTLSEGD